MPSDRENDHGEENEVEDQKDEEGEKGRSIAEEEALGGQEERADEVGRQEGEADAPQGRSPEVEGCGGLQARRGSPGTCRAPATQARHGAARELSQLRLHVGLSFVNGRSSYASQRRGRRQVTRCLEQQAGRRVRPGLTRLETFVCGAVDVSSAAGDTIRSGTIVATPILAGLHHRYARI